MTAFITARLGLGVLVGGVLTEPTAAEYQRQQVTFTALPAGVGSNDAAANFGVVVTSWGTLTTGCLFDGAGNAPFGPQTLTSPINGAAGETVTVMAGAFGLVFTP